MSAAVRWGEAQPSRVLNQLFHLWLGPHLLQSEQCSAGFPGFEQR